MCYSGGLHRCLELASALELEFDIVPTKLDRDLHFHIEIEQPVVNGLRSWLGLGLASGSGSGSGLRLELLCRVGVSC